MCGLDYIRPAFQPMLAGGLHLVCHSAAGGGCPRYSREPDGFTSSRFLSLEESNILYIYVCVCLCVCIHIELYNIIYTFKYIF